MVGMPPWVCITGCTYPAYLKVYNGVYIPGYTSLCVRGVHTRVYFSLCVQRGASYPPFSLLCVQRGASYPCSQPLLYPFHCWSIVPALTSPVSLLGLFRRPCAAVLSVAGFPSFSTRFTVGRHSCSSLLTPVSLLDTHHPFHCWTYSRSLAA